jgi:hypothetical protein
MISWQAANNFGDTMGGGIVGPTGLVIILLLVVGTVLLIRNMNARLRRLPESFESPDRAQTGKSDADRVGSSSTSNDVAKDVATED